MLKQRKTWVLVGLLLAAGLGVRWAGLDEWFSVVRMREAINAAGPLGVLAFWLSFAVSALLAVPALVFILAALAAYGPAVGLPVAFVGSLLAATVAFGGVRAGVASATKRTKPSSGRLSRALEVLSKHPVVVVAGLRTLLLLSAPLNLALALSSIRYRDYIVGTAVGVVPPLVLYGATLECWLG